MNNINIIYRSKRPDTLSSLLNDAATTVHETCDNSQYKLNHLANINNNFNTCSCMLHLILLQVNIFHCFIFFLILYNYICTIYNNYPRVMYC